LELVRTPNRKEWLQNWLLMKLPYHPQLFPNGARFDAVLDQPLDFGIVQAPRSEFADSNAQPSPEQTAVLRLTNTVSSSDAKPGDPIRGVLSEPLFSPAHQLILPQGADFSGKITMAKKARMFHRGGELRFSFDRIATPAELASVFDKQARTKAQLEAVEQGATKVAVDEEGTAKATESNTRLLRPLVAGLVAAKSMDNDAGKSPASASGGANANYSGRALGGFSGFGLLGTTVVRAPKPVGAALGFYGLAWSVYSTVVSRGSEVTFEKNSAIQIRFGGR
jgi:hypothetical protein